MTFDVRVRLGGRGGGGREAVGKVGCGCGGMAFLIFFFVSRRLDVERNAFVLFDATSE